MAQRRCPCCSQQMASDARWDIHQVVERHKGGSDKLDNLVLLHHNCHRKMHVLNACK
ncbi:HNH endonuclease [Marinomonas sp. TI.3.20]|uniref:HNH endonuclease n=1 Tax=Marinomonas sp. TI.3.20 TaxID=3121296 RepID=UPI00311D6435